MNQATKQRQAIYVEGFSPEEILALPDQQIDEIVFSEDSLVFHVGTAEILGGFRKDGQTLIVELAQIEGGGEGVLPTLWLLVERYARTRGFLAIHWIVHAVNCAKPNLKLRRVLERRGFSIRTLNGNGKAYCKLSPIELDDSDRGSAEQGGYHGVSTNRRL